MLLSVNRQGEFEVYAHVGREIAKCRADAGLSQAALATAIGLTRTSISNIEKGRQKMLVHTLLDIAAALSVPVASLLPTGEVRNESVGLAFSGSEVSPAERATISAILDKNAKLERSVR